MSDVQSDQQAPAVDDAVPVADEDYAVAPAAPADVAPADLEGRLHQLEQMVAEAKAVPLSASIMLNKAEVDGLISEMRRALPEELKQARWVVKEREEIIQRAETEAERIVDDAQEHRSRLIAKTEVVKAANREADRIVEESRDQARQMRLEAEDYVDAKLANFEVVLHKTLGAVERGREKLRGRLDTDQLAEVADELEDEL